MTLPRRPLYETIAERLREEIASGELAAGQALPSETALMAQFNTGRHTVRSAVAALQAEGLVDTLHGRGSFVRRRAPLLRVTPERFGRRRRRAGTTPSTGDIGDQPARRVEVQGVARRVVPADVRGLLQLSEGEQVLERRVRCFAGGQPVELSTSWFPLGLVESTPIEDPATELWPDETVAELESIGVHVSEMAEEITTRMPTPREIREFDLSVGVPVIKVCRTMLADARPAVVSVSVMAGDRHVLVYRLPVD